MTFLVFGSTEKVGSDPKETMPDDDGFDDDDDDDEGPMTWEGGGKPSDTSKGTPSGIEERRMRRAVLDNLAALARADRASRS